jgi:endonuclease/exonuclease/phosphatase family metal-dependent hydrolase
MNGQWSVSGAVAALLSVSLALPAAAAEKVIRYQAPEFLTFEELQALSANPYPTGRVRQKFEHLWTMPMISNEAYLAGARPHQPSSPQLGTFVRAVTWNIEQSRQMDQAIAAFTDEAAFARGLHPKKARPGSRRYRRALAERALLETADIILLQEMDIGVKRSGYRDAARDLAQALQMNYAYLPEYLEIDPVLLGTERVTFEQGLEDTEATAYYAADPKRFKGLFGCAVLSRYPIRHAEGFRLFNQGYDWYWQEKLKLTFIEKLRRLGARQVFHEHQHREMKVGGRTYFRVDLAVPDVPEGTVSVINVHLEIKCQPHDRAEQLAEILHYIKDLHHPVILAGDFNSAPADISPTSTPRVIKRGVSSPEFWVSRAIEYLLPQALLLNTARFIANVTKNSQNPTALHIPLIAPNPSGELFSILQRFQFNDGRVFDFRSTRGRSAGGTGKLANSNERDLWAYKTTFRVDRTLAKVIGKYRLDWFFIKAYLTRPFDRRGSYRFAPHFGRTLNWLNKSLTVRISDHDPCVVDLPLQEPPPQRRRGSGRRPRGVQ